MGWFFESKDEARRRKQAELTEKLEDTNFEMQQKYGEAIKEARRKKKSSVFSRSANPSPDAPQKSFFAKLFPCCHSDDAQPEAKQVGRRMYKKI